MHKIVQCNVYVENSTNCYIVIDLTIPRLQIEILNTKVFLVGKKGEKLQQLYGNSIMIQESISIIIELEQVIM